MRTMFYYGNYDGKSSTPSFSVVFEGKHRGTLSISSAFEPYLLELIFSPAGGETSVCFVRTSSSSNPFVSSIEVVDLDDGMYAELGPGEGLFYQQRRAYGATEFLRSDLQGRFWLPSEINILVTGIQSTAVSIDTSGASNKPPESVLRNSWTGEGLSLVDPTLPSAGVPVYLAMYFSEPLESSLRSFNIFFGGKQVGRGPVVPLFGKATQVVVRDVVASSSTLLTLWSTSSALLPPMINAAELYVISKGTSESTGGNETGSGSGSGSGGSGGGGSGSSGSGSGSGGTSKGGTGGSNEVSPGGSTNGKSSKLPIILGVVSPVAFVLVAYVFIAIILANRRKVRLQALAMPTSTVATMGTGPSTLFTQQMDNDSTSNQPTNEMGEIDDLTG